MSLDDVNDHLHTEFTSEDYDSLGGYITELLDHIPSKGESVTDNACIYKVIEMDKKRVARVLVTMMPKAHNDNEE